MVSAGDQTAITAEIKLCEEKLLTAVKNRDLVRLDELIHEDLLFVIPGGHTATKTMDLEAHRSGQMTVHDAISHEQIIHVIGDVAVASVHIELKASYQGQNINGHYRYLRIWRSNNGSWQIIAGSCTPMP